MKVIGRSGGTTLLEVLIAIGITGVITTAILMLYVTQHENYLTQDDITTAQQNARASIDELTRQIRMAGHQLPGGLQPILASNTNPDTITIAFENLGCDTYLQAAMPLPSAELKCGSDVSCFRDGMWVYIYDPDSANGEWFEITHVQTGSNHIQHNTMTLSKKYDSSAIIIAINQAKFYIDNTTDPDNPKLMVQSIGQLPQVYAENIVDLQFQYRLSNGMVVDQPVVVPDIREVIISVTAQWTRASGNAHYVKGDVNQAPLQTRTYTSSVNMRNLGV